MKVLGFKQWEIANYFIEQLQSSINESDQNTGFVESVLTGLSKDLKFNLALVSTFGAGIKAMYPIVENLVKNQNLSIDLTTENIILLTLASLAITYLEENGNRAGDEKIRCDCQKKSPICDICKGTGVVDSIVTKSDARTILEELKLRGIGNGIVERVKESFKSIGRFLKTIFKKSSYVITGLTDMLGYTMILIPTMNALSAVIGEYNLNLETLSGNLLALAAGVGTFLSKNIYKFFVNKIKQKINVDIDSKHLDTPISARNYDIIDSDEVPQNLSGNKLINEQ